MYALKALPAEGSLGGPPLGAPKTDPRVGIPTMKLILGFRKKNFKESSNYIFLLATHTGRETERERDRERETERDRERERATERDRETDRERDRQRENELSIGILLHSNFLY